MSATTTASARPELKLAMVLFAKVSAGDLVAAVAIADQGASQFPKVKLPAPQGQAAPTFAEVAAFLRAKLDQAKAADSASAAAAAPADPQPAQPAQPAERPAREEAPRPVSPAVTAPPAPDSTAAPSPATEGGVSPVSAEVCMVLDPQGMPAGRFADVGQARAVADSLGAGACVMELGVGGRLTGKVAYQVEAGQPVPPAEPEVQAEPEPAAKAVLRIEHTVVEGTRLLGTDWGDGVKHVIGSGGQKWRPSFPQNCWYIRGSRGYAADQARIDAAVQALGSAGWQVEVSVDNVDPETGRTVEPRSQKQRAGRASTRAAQRVVPTADAAPAPVRQVESAPVLPGGLDFEAAFAEIAAYAAASSVPMAECPTCRLLVELCDGELKPHQRPMSSAACRGRLGRPPVVDVEAEPAIRPARRTVRPAASATGAPQTVAAPPTEEVEVPLRWKFVLAEGARGKQIAAAVRRDLYERVGGFHHLRGQGTVRCQVRYVRGERSLTVTITAMPHQAISERVLAAQIKGVCLTVPGVAGVGRI